MKKIYKTLKGALGLFLGTSLIVSNSFSQTVDVQIGTETATATDVPISSCWGYSYTQQILLASELTASGIPGSAEITTIRFYYSSGATGNNTDWTIYLGNSSKTSFTSNTDWEVITNLSNVFSGTVTYPAGGNWMEITLDTPFLWDGTSNLIVAVDENQAGFNCSINWRRSALGANRSIYYRHDSTNPDPASPPAATSRVGYVSNIQLVAEPPADCSGTPSLTDILSSTGTEACINENLTLSLLNGGGLYFLNGITYQWQSFDGTNWNDISGATNSTLEITDITESTEYHVVIGCSISGEETILAPISINVNENPTVVVDIDASVVCPSTAVTVTASGANTYVWSPAAGLNTTNAASVDALPTASTTYTVTGTDANGCIGTAQTAISTYASVATQTTTNPTEICEPNSPVSVEIVTPASVQGGNWEYRFLNADGVTEAQTWNTTNSYNFIPTTDSVYTYYVQLRNSACGTALDSVKTTVVVGFGAEDVIVVDYDCHNLAGSATLVNPFGQKAVTDVYSNDFNAPADLSAFTLFGNTSNIDGRLQLTASATSVNGHASLSIPEFSTGFNNSFTISFDLTADTPIDTWGTGGADGITYSFGNDATPTANGTPQNGRGTKLRLSFDSAGNSDQNNNQAGIYLVYGWTANNAFGPGSSQTLAYSNNTSLWKTKTDVPVVFDLKADGKADLTVDGVVVFENIQLPAAYLSADVSDWKHLFSAGTGGDALRHAIDNINITASSSVFGITQSSTAPTTWQTSTAFNDLAPGTYYIWSAKDSTAACSKMIETIVIENTNPVVNLGADTTICEGETLILDAQNTGATYVWSGTNIVTQTLEVSNAGTYSVYATMPNGCYGIGNINVAVNDVPTATGIYRQGTYPNFTYTVLNANNADSYDWNFGDGTTLTNAPATVSHYYSSSASVTVTATLSNDCGSTTVSQNYGDLSIASNELEGLEMYPNPTSGQFTVSLVGSNDATVTVISTTGAIVLSQTEFTNKLTIETNQWESGIYFVTVSNNGIASTQKLIVK